MADASIFVRWARALRRVAPSGSDRGCRRTDEEATVLRRHRTQQIEDKSFLRLERGIDVRGYARHPKQQAVRYGAGQTETKLDEQPIDLRPRVLVAHPGPVRDRLRPTPAP